MSILETATAVLRLMAARQSEVTMSDLVERLNMPKSTASRVLKQMAEEGLLTRNPTTLAYRPSLLLLELSHLVRSSTPLIEMCAQALDALGQEYGHTGYVSVLEGNDVVVLRVRPGSQALRAMTNPGHRSPSWATSTGRSLLARESEAEIRGRFPEGLPHLTLNGAPIGGPATLDALITELDATRQRRYAVAENEALSGVCSVGCAVADPDSGESLSFCMTFPSATLPRAEIDAIARSVASHAELIGRSVGDAFWTSPR
ncbi:Transcriptional regulator KdgR [Pandoraea terrae]|uniref:Transcriptional regulator KdgR n=1 Tax=Pandoraea terrae TaxID=1537710 RepID=A0A5E4Z8I3_9BURK|nr:IclR family transcriptional regulator [Pandoraea terrae]VVE57621.1 Transcriptional regulator KdgR [Pandoraea terrae]